MKHITLIVPFVPFSQEAITITEECLEGFKGGVDRIIAVENGGELLASNKIIQLADEMIRLDFNINMAGAVNTGFIRAVRDPDCEFLVFANNDITYNNVDFQELCEKGWIRSPKVINEATEWGAHGSCFAVHRADFAKIGWWRVDVGNSADTDWFQRARDRGILLETRDDMSVNHEHAHLTYSNSNLLWEIQ